MILNKRLAKILSFVNDGASCVFDIGADHGYLTQCLIADKNVQKVIASDISEKSLQKVIELTKKQNLTDRISCIVSDGLEKFPKEQKADYVVIAGMGEREIIKILSRIENHSLYDNFILQPMQEADELRDYLLKNNFIIESDQIVEDNEKYYSVIVSKKSNKQMVNKDYNLYFGKTDLMKPSDDFIRYVKTLKNSLLSREKYLKEEDKKKLQMCESILKINKKVK